MSETPEPAPGRAPAEPAAPTDQPPFPPFGGPPVQQYAGYGPYPGYGGYPYPVQPPQQQRSGLAVAALVLGLVGLCTSLFYVGGVVGIVGLVFSVIALRAANRTRGPGRSMAIWGLVTSILAIVVNAVEIVFLVFLFHSLANCAQYRGDQDPYRYDNCVSQHFSFARR